MSIFDRRVVAAAACLWSVSAAAQDIEFQIGTPVSSQELSKFFTVLPNGSGLPPGEGTAAAGRKIYAERCAHCHGDHLEGSKEVGGPALVGGRDSLASDKPVKTVESYWPYTSTLYDYIWRSMPFDQPGSLTADEVYALSAYILFVGGIVDEDQVLNAKKLPQVVMPNVNGFYDGSGPELDMYRNQEQQSDPQAR